VVNQKINEKIDKLVKMHLILGMPVSCYPVAPEDQPGCIIESCPKCYQDIWISKKKRELRETLITQGMHYEVWCWDCLEEDSKNGIENMEWVKEI
jgi:hypothetical protein